MSGSILIDGRIVPVSLPSEFSLSVAISIVERALFKKGLRIDTVLSEGEDLFSAKAFTRPWSSFKEISCTCKQISTNLKKAVVTLTIGDKHDGMKKISHRTMQTYAKNVGADFLVIDEIKLRMKSLLLEKWQMFDLLFNYDRIMFFDTDVLVARECPDLFNIVPLDNIGAFPESDYVDRKGWVSEIQLQLGDIGWKGQYLNSGVVICSYIHRPVFDRTLPYVVPGDQHTFNYRVKQNGFKVLPLSHKFNHMELCSEDRFSSFIIHYAGSGFTGIECSETERLFEAKVEKMKSDANRLFNM